MITTRFYLDCRAVRPGAPAPLRLVLTKNGVRAFIPLNVSLLPTQWDISRQMIIGHPRKQQLNSQIAECKLNADGIIYRLQSDGELLNMRACDIKKRVMAELYPSDSKPDLTFLSRYNEFVSSHSAGTQRVYRNTLHRLQAFTRKQNLGGLRFEDITVAWLRRFDAFLAQTSPSRNARNIHFRNIRAIFNDTITDGLISCYPFRKFKITPESTRKRALTLDQLREVLNAQGMEPFEQQALDCFKLIFFLCGINVVDLCRLRKIVDGRIEYSRAKTHRLYSIKVEPEAMAIIAQYWGSDYLLSYLDDYANYRSFYASVCRGLAPIGYQLGMRISTYWARHSWATIAASLDIPKETIAAALGHGGNSVTDIYIDFDRRKIDEANRRVIDYVLYGKQ
ncbi:recombinase [Paramuribaculum intestinale]|uniref:Recombinase n=2 Tax=Paramuribaculum intestinale TaxID=2094151 RepID=A0A2V1IY95_9BACT|nr:site-specific integrase [Paramuribaculum intestinale]MBJ2186423.1 site-specific integrase [Muribaculaceae bacterium]PWB07932.1 recombinase [Paramuribaculum intestinale]WLT42914.1 site-specific integrase [Paramuribaculum intestinale]